MIAHGPGFIGCTLTFLVLTGCAGAGPGGPAECRSDLRRAAESVGEALDSSRTQLDLEKAWVPGVGLVLATLSFDSLGVRDTVQIYSGPISESARAELVRSLLSNARSRGVPDSRYFLFLGDVSGPGLRRVNRFAGCRPSILNGDWLSKQVNEIGNTLRLSNRRSVRLWAFVDADGRVGRVRIEEGSGHLVFDQEVARLFQLAEFKPAAVEGFAIPVWVAVPVSFTPHRRGGGRPSES